VTDSTRLRAALVGHRREVVRSLLAGVGVALSSVALAATSAGLIVRAAERPAILTLTVPMGLVQLFALAKAAGRYGERLATHRSALAIMGHLRVDYARALEPLVPAGLGPDPARAVDTLVGDVERVQDLLLALLGPLTVSLLAGLISLVAVGVLVPESALGLGVGLLLVAVVLPLVGARLARRSDLAVDRAERRSHELWSRVSLAGEEMALTGATPVLAAALEEMEDDLDRARAGRARVSGVIEALSVAVSGLTVLYVVEVSVRALSHHQLSRTLLAVPTLLALALLDLLAGVSKSAVTVPAQRQSLARLEHLFHVTPPATPAEDARPPDAGVMTTRGLVAGYDGGTTLCADDLEIRPGEWWVVTGPSGRGKTTLLRTLARFLDAREGAVALGGVEYPHLDEVEVRARVGFVEDSPHVFATSLGANLRLARPSARDSELVEALEVVQLGEWWRSLPAGLDTSLGGVRDGLSGGERRRLGLARALLRDDEILLLDEPTEGLDDETARRVLGGLKERFPHLSVVVVSHSPLLLEFARPWPRGSTSR
jgi:thiol reductant ABC exporter CydC subunit